VEEMQQRVCEVHDVDELKQSLIDVWHGLTSVINDAADEWFKRLCVCNSCERE